jgi:hypothetical protein
LQDLPGLLLVAAAAMQLRERAVDLRQRVLATLRAVDVGQQLVVRGLLLVGAEGALRERLRLLRLAQVEQRTRELCDRRRPARLELEDAAIDLRRGLDLALASELLGDLLVLRHRLVVHALLPQQLRNLHPAGRVLRVDHRHLAQQLEGLSLATAAVMAVGGGLECTDRLGGETHALVELGERLVGVVAIRVEIQDLLVDRDGAGVEALLRVLPRDLRVGRDRLLDLTPATVGVADLEPQLRVARVELDELLVLRERLLLRALLGELARVLEDLSLVRCQEPPDLEPKVPAAPDDPSLLTYRLRTAALEVPAGKRGWRRSPNSSGLHGFSARGARSRHSPAPQGASRSSRASSPMR